MTLEEVFGFVFNKSSLAAAFSKRRRATGRNDPFPNGPVSAKNYSFETQLLYIQEALSEDLCGASATVRLCFDKEECVWYAENIHTKARVEFKKKLAPSDLNNLC